MESVLQQGIAAAKAGEKERAFQLLMQATREHGSAESAWLWLSGVVEQDEERLFCLDQVLQINPNNEPARHGAAALRQKGILPALPSGLSSLPGDQGLAEANLKEVVKPETHQPAVVISEVEKSAQGKNELYHLAAVELARKIPAGTVVNQLTGRGVPQETARRIVLETERSLKKVRGDKYRRRMMRGFLWTMAGTIITCGTYVFANNLGGGFLLCWGAILIGVIDFLVGLVGWMANQ